MTVPEWPEREDERYVKWIPLVVPLFAVLLLLAVLVIDSGTVYKSRPIDEMGEAPEAPPPSAILLHLQSMNRGGG